MKGGGILQPNKFGKCWLNVTGFYYKDIFESLKWFISSVLLNIFDYTL